MREDVFDGVEDGDEGGSLDNLSEQHVVVRRNLLLLTRRSRRSERTIVGVLLLFLFLLLSLVVIVVTIRLRGVVTNELGGFLVVVVDILLDNR